MIEGWCSVEELTLWGFDHARVVMANEAHNGIARCVRTREVGIRIIGAAHQSGVRRLAMEALPGPADSPPGPVQAIPQDAGGYLAQPEMGRLITTALDLGWSLWAYEAHVHTGMDQARLRSPSRRACSPATQRERRMGGQPRDRARAPTRPPEPHRRDTDGAGCRSVVCAS